ncbi:MAG: hypothetical protein J5848_06535 [Bacteroidales bacterium]|nr:hypothetical protein [Bacteroidales bacterium]
MELNELISKLNAVEQAIANYEELDSDMDSPEYVARGNGFCDSKYSEDFIESQIAKLHCEKESIEREISLLEKRN